MRCCWLSWFTCGGHERPLGALPPRGRHGRARLRGDQGRGLRAGGAGAAGGERGRHNNRTTRGGSAPREEVALRCEAPNDELLFAEWLNSLVFEMAVNKMLFSRFEVHINDGRLDARAWGERVDVARHRPAVEVKGATYTALRVARDCRGQWLAQTVVDV